MTPITTTVIPNVTESIQTTTATQQPIVEKYYMPEADAPYQRYFGYNSLSDRIQDCVMKQAFPDVANDLNYGTKANPPKVIGISAFEYRKFEREYVEGKGQTSTSIGFSCQDTPGTDTWNFIEVVGDLVPRNARPSVYEVTLVVKKTGKTIAQIKSNQTFTLDQNIKFYSYIPIRQKEIADISGCELQFTQLTNI